MAKEATGPWARLGRIVDRMSSISGMIGALAILAAVGIGTLVVMV
jgi:hypothetical protein